jgi:hypothetical protein
VKRGLTKGLKLSKMTAKINIVEGLRAIHERPLSRLPRAQGEIGFTYFAGTRTLPLRDSAGLGGIISLSDAPYPYQTSPAVQLDI